MIEGIKVVLFRVTITLIAFTSVFLMSNFVRAQMSRPFSKTPSKTQQVSFSKRTIKLAGREIKAEIADTHERRERGLMFREKLGENEGMLFIFEEERPLAFWMRNTLIPLSIAYFNSKKELIETLEMVPAVMGEAFPKTYPSSQPAKYALEMPKGWFAKNKVPKGAVFQFLD